jgi:hypothetical protein
LPAGERDQTKARFNAASRFGKTLHPCTHQGRYTHTRAHIPTQTGIMLTFFSGCKNSKKRGVLRKLRDSARYCLRGLTAGATCIFLVHEINFISYDSCSAQGISIYVFCEFSSTTYMFHSPRNAFCVHPFAYLCVHQRVCVLARVNACSLSRSPSPHTHSTLYISLPYLCVWR